MGGSDVPGWATSTCAISVNGLINRNPDLIRRAPSSLRAFELDANNCAEVAGVAATLKLQPYPSWPLSPFAAQACEALPAFFNTDLNKSGSCAETMTQGRRLRVERCGKSFNLLS